MKIGYARVSTDDQSAALDQQLAALKAEGCNPKRIFIDRASGATRDREGLAKAIAQLREGDTLVVCKLDRLARNTADMLDLVGEITKEGASFKSIAEPWCDTSAAGELMLTIFAGVAAFERARMKERQREGIDRARNGAERRADGRLKYAGRVRSVDRGEVLKLLGEGIGPAEIARRAKCSRQTVYRIRDEAQSVK